MIKSTIMIAGVFMAKCDACGDLVPVSTLMQNINGDELCELCSSLGR
jgi:hypothetical protein